MARVRTAALATAVLAMLGGCTLLQVAGEGPRTPSAQHTVAGPAQQGAGRQGKVTEPPSPGAGGAASPGLRILTMMYPAPALGGMRRVLVLLPKDYGRGGVR